MCKIAGGCCSVLAHLITFFALGLQFISSVGQIVIYAGNKIILDHEEIPYLKSWLYRYRWAVLPLSALLAAILFLLHICEMCVCCLRLGRDGRTLTTILFSFSLIMAVLWAVLVGYSYKDAPIYSDNFNSFAQEFITTRTFFFPLDTGISYKNDCNASPFTLINRGVDLCKLLTAESILAIVSLCLWGISLLGSIMVFIAISMRKAPI
ncbi:hypothetical protein EV182_004911 [Spiromyces aspiralis]|uniref:Uncharacterized protein n=1 Tax=Spiromyces aspiralis TaxID=68401 RepID=A0ACC1HAN1_9FUNG|nr:hypothetical protein EV182_004911 [Spiromyces aspiralis]